MTTLRTPHQCAPSWFYNNNIILKRGQMPSAKIQRYTNTPENNIIKSHSQIPVLTHDMHSKAGNGSGMRPQAKEWYFEESTSQWTYCVEILSNCDLCWLELLPQLVVVGVRDGEELQTPRLHVRDLIYKKYNYCYRVFCVNTHYGVYVHKAAKKPPFY